MSTAQIHGSEPPSEPTDGHVDTAFGLDLAGYSTDGSALARAGRVAAGSLHVTVYRNHCFGRKAPGHRLLADVARPQVELLVACLRHSRVVVDVPIDLQGLPGPADPRFVWELTMRPADYAFAALTPLAQLIGSYVARFLHLRGSLPADVGEALGKKLFETYPAASLGLMRLPNKKYKGSAYVDDSGGWVGQPDESRPRSGLNRQLAKLLNTLGWTAPPSASLTHDEFDAAMCALTGVATPSAVLAGSELGEEIRRRIEGRLQKHRATVPAGVIRAVPPQGYILLTQRPVGVRVSFARIEGHGKLLDELGLREMPGERR